MAFGSMICCGKGFDRKEKGKKQPTWRVFSLKELHAATNNFNYDNKLGEGGFGSVYWGQLWDGSQIAVKRLKVWSDKAEMEFSVEVEILARVRHKNLLSLRGYCAEGQERLIVYDYMPNLSLLSHLHGHHSAECLLNWNRRMNIAIGSAEGIAYLHHHATPHIIHRDVKASNVLLDSDFNAQVADFGFAKLIPDELATGKRPLEKLNSPSMKRTITDWALPLACEGRLSELADPRLNGKYDDVELKRAVFVGLICAQSRPEKRPTMPEVVELLKGDLKEKLAVIENDDLFKNPQLADSDDGSDFISEEREPKQVVKEVKV
ncbi:hypothetical protein Vadar_015254 [Vaccinium darrowii]|uniref:Uncharacterized protein n=1 Tax=Vaccinium darrowii TaxID=229202 RepID=A0ACB7ZKG0_9ERIC|nr:hypothetical protein Vadar_015254 [Vaccinium darrowii]